MTPVKIDFENGLGHTIINVDKILYIVYHKDSIKSKAYAEVHFDFNKPSMVLTEKQYQQLMVGRHAR